MSAKRYVINCVGQFYELGDALPAQLIGTDTVVVLASDYDALAAENERLHDLLRYEEARFRLELGESERLREALQNCVDCVVNSTDDDPFDLPVPCLDRARAALSSGKEVGV
jgi:hypothetical protein